tara:strand:- start:1344 stop:2219 length:876 start_codon:yes stop_codon:yes gene_type:complete
MNLIKRIIISILVFLFLIEISLRIIGFGNPIIYENNVQNFYPKENQNSKRYKNANIKINHLGMRTNFSWENYKQKEKILFFGDSVTYGGSYIDNKDLFSEKICTDYLINSICGNFGVNGYQFENIQSRIKQINEKYYDQIIILTSNVTNSGKSNFNDFPFYEKYDYSLLKATTEVFNHFLFKYKIYDAFHSNSLKKNKLKKNKLKKNSANFIDELSKYKKVKIFILPTLEDLNNQNKKSKILELQNFKSNNPINLYDFIIKKNYKDLYFNNAHLNKKGHEYIAKIIYNFVK